jgi:hypothetical protein
MQLAHTRHSTPEGWTLADYRDQIIREIDGLALRVGALLRQAKAQNPDHFNEWVEKELPFGMETARRMMGISAAYEKLPAEKLRLLPRPWQAMYALKALSPKILLDGMESGEINPDMTVRAARRYASRMRDYRPEFLGQLGTGRASRADVVAGMLMQFGAHEMSPGVRRVLTDWLGRATASDPVEESEAVGFSGG